MTSRRTAAQSADDHGAQQKLFASVKRRLDRENPGYER
jgi:ribosomal protein L17